MKICECQKPMKFELENGWLCQRCGGTGQNKPPEEWRLGVLAGITGVFPAHAFNPGSTYVDDVLKGVKP